MRIGGIVQEIQYAKNSQNRLRKQIVWYQVQDSNGRSS